MFPVWDTTQLKSHLDMTELNLGTLNWLFQRVIKFLAASGHCFTVTIDINCQVVTTGER